MSGPVASLVVHTSPSAIGSNFLLSAQMNNFRVSTYSIYCSRNFAVSDFSASSALYFSKQLSNIISSFELTILDNGVDLL